ncbi:sensor histidine kinase [Alkaliphilus peptidifermentans]|uniref:histidine kinase n=1 Tax=Alkaliphilus peptidifermentans DSM 18978 TaxID=1120976 RepID=A0A1G5J1G4_9FIRM|nr:HAMP domain-containing sensor histidine kinase [Alkaliphilus peptidifermentans]SCY82196.1 Signal transduction histidine kinase [Alkaliphilus peptidifermentans DSM 18978]
MSVAMKSKSNSSYNQQAIKSLEAALKEKELLLNEILTQDRMKTEFLSNISHDLRTPLNVIYSTLQLFNLFLNDSLSEDKKQTSHKYIHIMKQNCYRLLRLINNFIDISKIDSGFLKLDLRNFDIVSLVEDITMSVAEYIENKSIHLHFDSSIKEQIIACDPDKIERIMLNLLSNSLKFTPKNGTIHVKVRGNYESVTISVIDTGIGIPSKELNTIFERFKQVDKGLTKDHQGSGIGLSLVKSLVELHGGNILINSEYGKGSEFIITLPIKTLDDDFKIAEEVFEASSEGRIERINIEFSDIYTKL